MPEKKTFTGDTALADARAFVDSQEVKGLAQRKIASLKRADSCIEKAIKSAGASPKWNVTVTINDYGEFEKLEWKTKLLQSLQQCTS